VTIGEHAPELRSDYREEMLWRELMLIERINRRN
jgi:hypothetical protein